MPQERPRRCCSSAAVAKSGNANPDERARLWPKTVDLYPDFDNYQSWTDREIPVVMLKPR
jgi:F420H(2)-dependent quinone reductase